jgi:hypothetical protein
VWLCVAIAALGAAGLGAQDEKITTLHAYSNLVQIPVLVLGNNREPLPPIEERRFFVSLDSGPRFRVTHARLEGDDPISLAILLDLGQPDPRLMDEATGPAALKNHVDVVLQPWVSRGHKRAKGCQKRWPLWDSLAAITRAISRQPGRHVILAVTDGEDEGSKNSWNDLREFAQERGVAIFGLVQPDVLPHVGTAVRSGYNGETIFTSLCELTGGLVLTSDEQDLAKQLAWFVTLVRARYIVEFPQPRDTTVGQHDMQIIIEKTSAFIRSTGIGLPLDDPAILNDPTTIPSDPANAPVPGKRKILTPH